MRLRSLAQAWWAQVSATPLRSLALVAVVLLVAVSDAAWEPGWAGLPDPAVPAIHAARTAGEDGVLLAAPRRLVLVTLGTAGLAARRTRGPRRAPAL